MILQVIWLQQNYNMGPKFPAMMTMNINFNDHGIVILKNNGDRDLNMINVVKKILENEFLMKIFSNIRKRFFNIR